MNFMFTSSFLKNLPMTAAGAALVALRMGSAAQAATFTNPANGNQYFLTTSTTWTDAQAQAVAAGGNLVTINDAAEQNWLSSVFGTTELFWIGLTDRVTEGVFQWVSGQPVTYTNWAPREPNNYQPLRGPLRGEDYVNMNWHGASRQRGFQENDWNDNPNLVFGRLPARGIVEIEGILEVKAATVPEPASVLGLLAVSALGAGSTLKRILQSKA
jgi:hypothetical protein